VSLNEVLTYAADTFCLLTDVLARGVAQPFSLVDMASDNSYRQDFIMKLGAAYKLCVRHGWKETAHQISQVGEYLDSPTFMPLVLQSKCADLEKHLLRVLNGKLFFHANEDCVREWDKSRESSANWEDSFPHAFFEMMNSRQCYLFEMASASVFHSMRALEIGLTSFAKKLKVQVKTRDQWETVIGNIESAIKKTNGPHAGSTWKDKQDKYSEAALHFRFLKNAWRNHVMHVRHMYELPKALEIMEHVSEFMYALKIMRLQEPNAKKFYDSPKQ
jgi:hypothetical protein